MYSVDARRKNPAQPDLRQSLAEPALDRAIAAGRPRERSATAVSDVAPLEPTLRLGSVIKRLIGALILIEVALVALDYSLARQPIAYDLDTRLLFALREEVSIPTWFNATQTGLVGFTAIGILLARRYQGARRLELIAWASVASFFVFMAVDDAARVHERVGSAIGDVAIGNGLISGEGIRSYYWITFLGPLFAAFGVFMVAFLWRAFGRYGLRSYLLFGPALYAAAIGLDFIEGLGGIHESIAGRFDLSLTEVIHFFLATEEYLEMVGTTVMLFAFLTYMAHTVSGMSLRLAFSESPATPAS